MSAIALRHAKEAVHHLFGLPHERRFNVRYWDGSSESGVHEEFTLVVARQGSLRRMLLPPNELSMVEAFISGDIEIEGDLERAMTLGDDINQRLRSTRTLMSLVRHVSALPKEEPQIAVREHRASNSVERVGAQHAPERDQAAVRYHYDVGNEFYALWLDERMVYSCAYFEHGDNPERDLDEAQRAKLDLVCRKLRLAPGERLLDVGCGWGALIMHAAQHYGVNALGITLSDNQASLARERIAAAGLEGKCTVEIRDYRALDGEAPFHKIASVGMVEHVGEKNLPTYFSALHDVLAPGGLLLNHGIVSVSASRPPGRWDWIERRLWKRDAFIEQYVFPDGRLVPLTAVIGAAEASGFETRDVHSLREHYALTLRAWISRLERSREDAIMMSDERTYRTWRLYMAGSAFGFASGRLNVVQTLLAKPADHGSAPLPLRRVV